jgi:HK97 family phage portal protein
MPNALARLWDRLVGKAAPAVPELGSAAATVAGVQSSPRRGTRDLLLAYRHSPRLRAVQNKVSGGVGAAVWFVTVNGERVENHPLISLLQQPYPGLTGRAALTWTNSCRDLTGNALWVLDRNAAGLPVQITLVPPSAIRKAPTSKSPVFELQNGSSTVKVQDEDAIWFRDMDLLDPYGFGTGIGESLADEIDGDEWASKYVNSFFINGGIPSAIVSAPGLSQAEARRMQASWDAKFRGPFGGNRTHFTGAEVNVDQLDASFQDLGMVELRTFNRDMFVEVYGVPPEVLGITESSNRATSENADFRFQKWVTTPRLIAFRDDLNATLVPQFRRGSEDLRLEFEEVIPADKEFTRAVMEGRPQAFSNNESRKLAGADPIEGEDELPAAVVPSMAPAQSLSDPPWARDLRALAESVTRAPEDEPDEGVPDFQPGLWQSDVEPIVNAAVGIDMVEFTAPVTEAELTLWTSEVMEGLGAQGRFDLLNPLIVEHTREQSTDRISGMILDTTRQSIRDQLEIGIRKGEDIRRLSKRIEEVFEQADSVRSTLIARTEVIRSSNYGTFESHVQSGVVDRRMWLTAIDGRERASHRTLNRVQVGIGEPFVIGDDKSMYPGNFSKAANVCNCRCTVVAVIEDPPEDMELSLKAQATTLPPDADEDAGQAAVEAYDDAVRPWEDKMRRATQDGFAKQADAVLAEMARRDRSPKQ